MFTSKSTDLISEERQNGENVGKILLDVPIRDFGNIKPKRLNNYSDELFNYANERRLG